MASRPDPCGGALFPVLRGMKQNETTQAERLVRLRSCVLWWRVAHRLFYYGLYEGAVFLKVLRCSCDGWTAQGWRAREFQRERDGVLLLILGKVKFKVILDRENTRMREAKITQRQCQVRYCNFRMRKNSLSSRYVRWECLIVQQFCNCLVYIDESWWRGEETKIAEPNPSVSFSRGCWNIYTPERTFR